MRLVVLVTLLSLSFTLAQDGPQAIAECRVITWTGPGGAYEPGAAPQRWECHPVNGWDELAELVPVVPALAVFGVYALGLTLGRAVWS